MNLTVKVIQLKKISAIVPGISSSLKAGAVVKRMSPENTSKIKAKTLDRRNLKIYKMWDTKVSTTYELSAEID